MQCLPNMRLVNPQYMTTSSSEYSTCMLSMAVWSSIQPVNRNNRIMCLCAQIRVPEQLTYTAFTRPSLPLWVGGSGTRD